MVAGVVACGGNSSAGLPVVTNRFHAARSSTPIDHVVIVIQENRSFDNFFATFPGADGAKTGKAAKMSSAQRQYCAGQGMPAVSKPTSVPLQETDLFGSGFGKSSGNFDYNTDLDHIHTGFLTDRDRRQDGRLRSAGVNANGSGFPVCTYPYQYVNPNDIAPYWDIAKQYVLADHTFQTQGSGSFTGHQDLIAAGTQISSDEALIDNPSFFPWGCDANRPVERRSSSAEAKKSIPLAAPFRV